MRRLYLTLVLLLTACGGGDGGSQSPSPPASASLSYPAGAHTFVIGTAITVITPTITGTLSNFSVNPALPAGLSLDSAKGTFSGAPQAVTPAATYTISAMVSGGTSTTASIAITVTDVAPSQVSYGASSLTYSTKVASSTLTPVAKGGTVVSWSISPGLPAGLNFSTTDGSISGKPSATAASAIYTVMAQNTGGQSTANLKIEVDGPPVLILGHQTFVTTMRETAANVLSVDSNQNWILWDYATATVLTKGNSGCDPLAVHPCTLLPVIDMAGTTAVIVVPVGLEVRSTSDGHVLGTITTSASWWKLATDGSYIATGNSSGLSAWSPSGQLLFSRPGDYSHGVSFAAPGEIWVAAGAAGQSVVETIDVPGGAAAVSAPPFNGQFGSWFIDGGRFTTVSGNTVTVYDKSGTLQGSIAAVPSTATVVGQGDWVWTYPNSSGGAVSVYASTAVNATATATYTFNGLARAYASATTIGVLTEGSDVVSIIDLSGSTPVKTDYFPPLPVTNANSPTHVPSVGDAPYAAVSASTWLVGNQYGVLIDGASLSGHARFFGFGQAWSIAGGTGHFAIALASGGILYFNSATLALEGAITFLAGKVALSADGSVLVAQGVGGVFNAWPLKVYGLPAGTLQYTWPYSVSGSVGVAAQDIELSSSGAVLGQVLFTTPGGGAPSFYSLEADATTGGSQILTTSFNSAVASVPIPTLRVSPDGTLIATSQTGSPPPKDLGTDLLHNGTLVTHFAGLPAGWLDDGRLLVNTYVDTSFPLIHPTYAGCRIYGPDGSATGAACPLPFEVSGFQSVTDDTIYVPSANSILTVSTGAVGWMSADPFARAATPSALGAVAGSHIIFVSGTDLLAQSFGQ
jgi:hypothetical protein